MKAARRGMAAGSAAWKYSHDSLWMNSASGCALENGGLGQQVGLAPGASGR